MLGRTGKCAWLFVVLHFYCQLSSFVLFSRGVVFTNTVIKEGEETTTMAACRLFVRSRRNPKEGGGLLMLVAGAVALAVLVACEWRWVLQWQQQREWAVG